MVWFLTRCAAAAAVDQIGPWVPFDIRLVHGIVITHSKMLEMEDGYELVERADQRERERDREREIESCMLSGP